jgi:AcrR family transcriptional regulator
MGTKERITRKALELFNQHGIEYAGMRELAASLGMQIGNITYYFPTKDDLVNQLALDLSALNEKTLAPTENLTIFSFLEMREKSFRNHHASRCLLLSFVHLIKQNPLIAKRYKKVGKTRGDGLIDNIKMLQKQEYLKIDSRQDREYLCSTIGLIARFWISDTAISCNKLPLEQQIGHYSGLIARMLFPYATKQGRIQIEDFLKK